MRLRKYGINVTSWVNDKGKSGSQRHGSLLSKPKSRSLCDFVEYKFKIREHTCNNLHMSGNYKNWPSFFFWNNPPECNSDIVDYNEQVCMWKVSYDIHIARLGQIPYFFTSTGTLSCFCLQCWSWFNFFFFAGWLSVILTSPLLTPPQCNGSMETNKMASFFSHCSGWMCSTLGQHTAHRQGCTYSNLNKRRLQYIELWHNFPF